MNSLLYAGLVVLYVIVMLAVGFWCMKRTKNVGDFFLGGRSLGPWMSAFAYGTTYFSAVLFIGYAGRLGWGFGIQTLWIVLGDITMFVPVLVVPIISVLTRPPGAEIVAMAFGEKSVTKEPSEAGARIPVAVD